MKKSLACRVFLILAMFAISPVISAQENSGNVMNSSLPFAVRLEAGVTTGGMSNSSSPITNAPVSTKTGFGMGFVVGPVGKPYEFSVKYAVQGHKVDLAGTELGGMDSSSLSLTARYRFDNFSAEKKITPYLGLGFHTTSFDGMTNGRGGAKTNAFDGNGLVAEAGLMIPIKNGFYADLNARQYFMRGDTNVTTSTNALITKESMKNPYSFGISLGYQFKGF